MPIALLVLGAAVISGFTALRGIDPFDEGLMLQAARRIDSGQVPYRDFFWVYGPGQPYLLAAAAKLLGPSLLWWRLLRVVLDVAIATTVFLLLRRHVGRGWALAAWLGAICTMAQPAGPTPFPVPLLLGLVVVTILSARSVPGSRAALGAGALAGVAAWWRLDFGAAAGLAALACLAAAAGPATTRLRHAGIAVAAGVAVGLVLHLPFAVAAGPGELIDSLVLTGTGGRGGLPIPVDYGGPLRTSSVRELAEDGKDVLEFYAPLSCIVGLGLAATAVAIRRGPRGPGTSAAAGLTVLGAGGLAYLLSRADVFHAQPLAAVLSALLPLAAVRILPLRAGRVASGVLAAVFAVLLAAGLANRLSALVTPPDLAAVDVPAADGVRARPAEARALERTVALLHERLAPGESTYVATRRSDVVRINNPMLYVLADRGNVVDHDFGPVTTGRFQSKVVAALARERPRAVVRWTDPMSTLREPNPSASSSGVRTLDRYLARRYRLLERNGAYQVLVPRG